MCGNRVKSFWRVIFAFFWISVLATTANARYFIEADILSFKSQVATTGLHTGALAALDEGSLGHHPEIVKTYQLPELKAGLFPSFDLSRQTGCLAVAIYYEARSEQLSGQVAVGQVILNRVVSRKYPNNICDVVYQNAHWQNRCQFSFACDGKTENPRNRKSWGQAITLARVLVGETKLALYAKKFLLEELLNHQLSRSTHYHATYVNPGWSKRLERSGKIGQHIFYISARVWS